MNFRILNILLALLCTLYVSACQAQPPKQYTYKVVKSYTHDTQAYTQGLFYHNGALYESTGQYGQSSLRKVTLSSGGIEQISRMPRNLFAEGACLLNNKIYQLTWQEQRCLVYDLNSFRQTGSFGYSTEGWGLTTDGKLLIMSDGSSTLYFRDPESFAELRRVKVRNNGKEIPYLNELEYINGEIWANIYTTDLIVRINPADGKVTGVIDLQHLLPRSLHSAQTDVLNGIAYDKAGNRIFVTGKNWPKLYEITLVEKK